MICNAADTVEQDVARGRRNRPSSSRPATSCPEHGLRLDNGPVQYRCPRGHRVQAADLNREVAR